MSRSRKPSLSLEERTQVVLSVLRGEVSVTEAARRHGVVAASVAKWRDRFIDAGRQGLQHGVPGVKRQGETAAERQLACRFRGSRAWPASPSAPTGGGWRACASGRR